MKKIPIIIILAVLAILFSWWYFGAQSNQPLSTDISNLPVVKEFQTVELKDNDSYTLTASYVKKEVSGKEQTMLAYNGMISGPTIRVQQGANVTIDFKNDTDLPAALHSHGVRMDNQYDGAPPITQQEIPPGGSFTYKLKFPDAGVFWYHPHVAEVYEQPLGLYRNIIHNRENWQRKSVAALAQALPFADASFDRVYGLMSLTYYEDPVHKMDSAKLWSSEIARVLKDGGEARLGEILGYKGEKAQKAYDEIIRQLQGMGLEAYVEQFQLKATGSHDHFRLVIKKPKLEQK